MSMIDDVIEYAHAEGLVLAVVQDDRGCDAYQLPRVRDDDNLGPPGWSVLPSSIARR